MFQVLQKKGFTSKKVLLWLNVQMLIFFQKIMVHIAVFFSKKKTNRLNTFSKTLFFKYCFFLIKFFSKKKFFQTKKFYFD